MHQYQNASVDHLYNNPKCGLFLDMGLGKTIITLTFLEYAMYQELNVGKALIVGPKRVAENVWTSEVKKWEHLKNLKLTKIVGTPAQRAKAVRENTDIHLISVSNIVWLCSVFNGYTPYDTLIIDESSTFKSAKSKRFKAL
jgi:SNF2 family DNA or RNA helicase